MSGDVHVRFCEGPGVQFPRATRRNIFVRSKRAGHRVMGSIRRFVEGRLRLKLNEGKSSVDRPSNLHFLGFRLTRTKEGRVEVHLSARTKTRLNRRIRELTPRAWGQSLNTCMKQLNRYLRGWFGYFRMCTESGAKVFKRFDAHARRRLRAIIVRQKGKRPRFLYRHLRACGVPAGSASKTAYCRRGAWFKSSTYGMHRAYGNGWFADRVVTLWPKWQQLNVPQWASSEQLALFET